MADGNLLDVGAFAWVAPSSGAARLFLVEISDAPDALVRVLSVFAVQQVTLASVDFTGAADGGRVRIEAHGLCEERAAHLSARLEAVPMVRGVSLGWRRL